MRVLTLWQPWATLIALGVKTIETRSQPAPKGLIGQRIAIHAAARPWLFSEAPEAWQAFCAATPNVVKSSAWYVSAFPLGVIVATAVLADSVPMVDGGEEGAIRTLDLDANGSLWIVEPQTDEEAEDGGADCREVTNQIPYGWFAPGRHAYLLTDVVPLATPVPFKGGQGWSRSWEPSDG